MNMWDKQHERKSRPLPPNLLRKPSEALPVFHSLQSYCKVCVCAVHLRRAKLLRVTGVILGCRPLSMAPFITQTEYSDLASWAKITRSKTSPQPRHKCAKGQKTVVNIKLNKKYWLKNNRITKCSRIMMVTFARNTQWWNPYLECTKYDQWSFCDILWLI